jgi:hypothetical protein
MHIEKYSMKSTSFEEYIIYSSSKFEINANPDQASSDKYSITEKIADLESQNYGSHRQRRGKNGIKNKMK